jgi:hypothetical protein
MKSRALLALLLLLATAVDHSGQAPSKLGPERKYTSVERMSLDRLRLVHEDRARHERGRRPVRLSTGYKDFRAILHAHAEDSPHTGGTRTEMLEAAKKAGVNVIMLTDHRRPERDFMTDSWRGIYDGVLFIPGSEAEGFLLYPMASIGNKKFESRDEVIRDVKKDGGNIFLSHVEEKLDWSTDNLDGLEIYNHHTDAKEEAEFNQWLQGALSDLTRLTQIEHALALYPQEVIAVQQDYLASIIKKWDSELSRHRLTAVAANDCHHNQVFTVTAVDDKTLEVGLITSRPIKLRVTSSQQPGVIAIVKGRKPGETIAKLDFDPYERSFRYVSTHILASRLTEQDVRDALRRGHAYVAHDWLCDPTGFAFIAEAKGGKAAYIMGDEVNETRGIRIKAEAPAACALKLFKDGMVIKTAEGRILEFEPKEAGVYRLEAWLSAGGELRPWIYSNPIYVR